MADRYKDLHVSEIQAKNHAGNAFGPRYKGIPEIAIDEYPELEWMRRARQDVNTTGSDPGEFIWVLADAWDAWRNEKQE